MDYSTIICRCEEITVEEIEEAICQGAKTPDDIKRLTRCGMGPCQAKGCRSLIVKIIAEKTGKDISEIPLPRMRIPLRPLSLRILACGHGSSSAVKSVLDDLDLGGSERRDHC